MERREFQILSGLRDDIWTRRAPGNFPFNVGAEEFAKAIALAI